MATTALAGGGKEIRERLTGFQEVPVISTDAEGKFKAEVDEILDAIRAGVTYANVHSTTFGGGEIRAELADD